MNRKTAVRILICVAEVAVTFLLPEKYRVFGFLAAAVTVGYDVVYKGIMRLIRGHTFDENLLMSISAIAAFCIKQYFEAVAILLFYQIGEMFQRYAVGRSRRSIADLMAIAPETVHLIKNGETVTAAPDAVEPGDLLLVKPGERVPVDGVVVEGTGSLNTASVTGESFPAPVSPGSGVISGSLNLNSALTVRATEKYENSTVAKILDLVENAASKKAPSERFISRFARYYTPAVVVLAVLLAVVPPLFNGNFRVWLSRAIVFLVVSCPCALVVSVPMAIFGGIGAGSRLGILFKGGDSVEKAAGVTVAAFDKTGTLTRGRFVISEWLPADGSDGRELRSTVAAAERISSHPLAAAFAGIPLENGMRTSDEKEFEGRGVSLKINGIPCFAGRREWLEEQGIPVPEDRAPGTRVYAAKGGKYLGCCVLKDEIKPEAPSALESLRAMKCRIVMLTGDNAGAAAAVAGELGIDEYESGLLPQEKTAAVERLRQSGSVLFAGDGINDAPTLMCADVGVSMGEAGSDSAVEASDIVLMKDDLSALPVAVKLAKRTMRKVRQNIVFSLAVKAAVLILGAFGAVNTSLAVFADVGVMILAVLNSLNFRFASAERNGGRTRTPRDKARQAAG